MLPLRHHSATERRLNRHATTVLLGGLFLTVCGLLFLSLCGMQCDDKTYGLMKEDDLARSRSKAFWQKHFLAPSRDVKAFLVIMVITGPQNRHQRTTIRQTWLSNASNSVLVKFVIGMKNLTPEVKESVEREQFIHHDLLLLDDLAESYHSLTQKVMMGFQWADHTVDYKYLLKVDDDSFVRLDVLLTELKQKPRERLYWGFFNGRAHVKKAGKWEEKNWFLCDKYLPYALGGGYILSSDLIHYISSNSEYLQQFNSEDISVGTWLGPLHIQRIHDQRFDTEFVSRGCRNDYLITHKQNTMAMQELHKNLQTLGHLCKKEELKRESYEYNWSVLPSKCCPRNDKILS